MFEARFVSPDRELVDQLVADALRAAAERADRRDWVRIEHGSANLVVVAGRATVRVSRTPAGADTAERAQRLIDALPQLPFAVPRSLAAPIRTAGLVAIAQQRIGGSPHPSGKGDPEELRRLLTAVGDVPLDLVREHLAPARSFMGGEQWFRVMTEQAIPLLDARARPAAHRAAEELDGLPPAEPRLVHGDLAGSNVLWEHGRVSGVLDWDLASADDPAEDVAALGAWHGWNAVGRASPPAVIQRAKVFAATYPLQVICFAILNARPPAELDRAIERANQRFTT